MAKRTRPDDRIEKLEAKLKAKQAHLSAEQTVVVGLPGELPTDTAARLAAEGRNGVRLIVPYVPEVETWSRQTSAYQAWLHARVCDISRDNFVGPAVEEIEAAYRKSLTV
jgi:hypothetical protein